MKRIGLIGGVSPESTVIYYRLLNGLAAARLGGQHSADVLIAALDYGVMIAHYEAQDWPSFTREVVAKAEALKRAGVDAIAITSNTTHLAADAVIDATGLPLIHLQDALVHAMAARGVKRPLLLGTPVVMSGPFYLAHLRDRFDGDVLVPDDAGRSEIGRVILDELVKGIVLDPSRDNLLRIIEGSRKDGADGVILGCTELCMILEQKHCAIPVLDTTAIHAEAVHRYAFESGEASTPTPGL